MIYIHIYVYMYITVYIYIYTHNVIPYKIIHVNTIQYSIT